MLVTDRRRLVRAAGVPHERWEAALHEQVEGAVAAGVAIVQVRERDLDARELARVVRALMNIAKGSSTRVVVNDRVDVALASGADGVHLREDSVAPAAVRDLVGAGWLIGRSVHGADALPSAESADLLVAGTVFASESKPGARPLLGLEGLAAVVDAATMPVLAIGGVTEATAGAVARAGAAGLASIGAFLPVGSGGSIAQSVQARAILLGRAFDTFKKVPYDPK